MKIYLTTREMAGLPGMAKDHSPIARQAAREHWPRQKRQGRGGGWEYHLQNLPPAAQVAWISRHADTVQPGDAAGLDGLAMRRIQEIIAGRTRVTLADLPAEAAIALNKKTPKPADREQGLIAYNRAPAHQRAVADARVAILAEYGRYRARKSHFFAHEARRSFCAMVEIDAIDLPEEAKIQAKRALSPRSLQRWESAYEKGGSGGLLPGFGHRKGATTLSLFQQNFVVGMLVDHPQGSVRMIQQGLEARFGAAAVPSIHSTHRFRTRWIRENAGTWLRLTDPDRWRSELMAAPGSYSEDVHRPNQRWEMDSTPADVMLSDGKRHQIIGVIDIYTRRAMLLVSRTSKSSAITSLIRRAILEWGVPEEIKMDNGQDYTAKHTIRVLNDLKITQKLCLPFSPWMKPHIERVFRTFSHGIVSLLPGFIGHNVADRKAIEARRSFAQRLMSRPDGGAAPVEIRLSAEQLQSACDQWCGAAYLHDTHQGIDGKSPFEMAAAWKTPLKRIDNERALDLLLFPAPDGKETRVIGKKGVRADNRVFQAPELWSRPDREEVQVRLDEGNLGYAYVFTLDMEFICRAEDPEWTGTSRAELAGATKAFQRRTMSEKMKELKATAKAARTREIHKEIQAARVEAAENIEMFPRASDSHSTPALEAAAVAHAATRPRSLESTPEEQARHEAVVIRYSAPKPPQLSEEEIKLQRYGRAVALETALAAGEEIAAADGEWLSIYRTGSEYRTQKRLAKYRPVAANQ